MGDSFLAQMDDFFTEGLCFDTSKEGKGERRLSAPPLCEGQNEGPEPREVEEYDRMLEAGALSTEGVAMHLGMGV
jgi:hypothetical protein